MNMEKILIIGGAGCVGHFMAGLLADAGHAPIIIDRVAAPSGLDQRVMDALLLPEQAFGIPQPLFSTLQPTPRQLWPALNPRAPPLV